MDVLVFISLNLYQGFFLLGLQLGAYVFYLFWFPIQLNVLWPFLGFNWPIYLLSTMAKGRMLECVWEWMCCQLEI